MDPTNAPPTAPNMLDRSTQQGGIISIWIVMFSLAALTVGLRFYTRTKILRILGVEDWLICAALVSG
jgi:hypothetical protein